VDVPPVKLWRTNVSTGGGMFLTDPGSKVTTADPADTSQRHDEEGAV
jgi:hypothetical protein